MTLYQTDEFSGLTHWWMPHWEAKQQKGFERGKVGSAIDITIHRQFTPKFSVRATELVQHQLIRADLFEGDFIGKAEWSLEEINGNTKLSMMWSVKTNRLLLNILGIFINFGKKHSDVVQKGFIALNDFLLTKK